MGRNQYAALRRENEELLHKLLQQDRDAKQKQKDLQETAEQLQKRLDEQSAANRQECQQLRDEAASERESAAQLRQSLGAVAPQLRNLLTAFEEDDELTRARNLSRELHIPSADFMLAEQRRSEGQALQLARVKDALKTHQDLALRNLEQREAILTCPISLELFENPVTTFCCGKTFSASALRQAVAQSSRCPVCRAQYVSSTPNRDVKSLVELHRTEAAALRPSVAPLAPTPVAMATPATTPAVPVVPAPARVATAAAPVSATASVPVMTPTPVVPPATATTTQPTNAVANSNPSATGWTPPARRGRYRGGRRPRNARGRRQQRNNNRYSSPVPASTTPQSNYYYEPDPWDY